MVHGNPSTSNVIMNSTMLHHQYVNLTKRWHGGPRVHAEAETIQVSFLQPDESIKTVDAKPGESFLQVAHRNDIDLEGACEGE
jgi:hypothetical protein